MRRNFYIFLTLVYVFLIFLLSSFPKLPTVEKPGIDKVEHAIEYSILGFLFLSCFERRDKKIILIAILIVSLYGVMDEFHQYFVPGRDCSVLDMAADFIGSFIGIGVRSKNNPPAYFQLKI